ncbi:hypothetical protein DPMN_124390 [Dreissena polymorpha]|uniref:Uncharacterized protein n=1 Tax=Dreissena polymorpha TaxID=45954 RepID=A0A9D4JSG7_DREPO|nr:hypothetical protein DPMN_124390 [Dreissena polymorpha]
MSVVFTGLYRELVVCTALLMFLWFPQSDSRRSSLDVVLRQSIGVYFEHVQGVSCKVDD